VRLLVIGGTRFVGRALAEEALARGDEVTLFTRGLHGADLFPQAEHLRGDRTVDLSPLAGRRFDAVVDTCGYVPRDVAASVRALRGSVGAYVLVSSASAYAHWPAQPVDETSPTFATAASAGPDDGHYGELKAGCERAVADGFGDRGLILRPGLIVGPHEHVGRLPAWLRRAARGGEMLAPGAPGDPLQLVDARDLAAFALAAVDGGLSGACNVVSDTG
jgi:2'-hydroxyisoflavone reductase